eukprot:s682_g12.t1
MADGERVAVLWEGDSLLRNRARMNDRLTMWPDTKSDQALAPLWDIFTSAWNRADQELGPEPEDEPVPAPLAIEDGVVSSSDDEDVPTTQPEQTEDSFDPYSDRVLGGLEYVVEEDPDASGTVQDSQDVNTDSQWEVPDSQPVDSPGVSPESPLVSPDPKSKTAEGPDDSSSMPPPPPLTPAQREARLAKINAKMAEIKYLAKTWVPMVTRKEQRGKGTDAEQTDEQPPGEWTQEEPAEPKPKRKRRATSKSSKTKHGKETKPKGDTTTNGKMDVEKETKKSPKRETAKAKAKSKAKMQPLKRPAARSSKAKEKEKDETEEKEMTANPKTRKTAKKDNQEANTEGGNGAEEGATTASKKQPATWAGRWIPQKEDAKVPFFAIKKVYEKFCAPKLHSQSTLASPFFAQCMKAFATEKIPDGAPEEDYLQAAELQAHIFLKTDRARYLALKVWKKLKGMYSLGCL